MSTPYDGWVGGLPPPLWQRVLAMDVGGASPNVMEWAAIDPVTSSIVFCAEVAKTTTDMREMATEALPKMKSSDGQSYNFLFKVGDYENKVALDEMGRNGVRFTNAVKHSKITSIHKLSSYLHPNPHRPFPAWHPYAGRLGAPLMYIMQDCKTLIREIPQQRLKEGRGAGDTLKDELDANVRHDAVDCALYVTRLLPAPAQIKIVAFSVDADAKSLQSQLYWADVKKQKEKMSETTSRKKYSVGHQGGSHWSSLFRLSASL